MNENKMIIGIDPGSRGALVVLAPDECNPTGYSLVDYTRMPLEDIVVKGKGVKKTKTRISAQGIVDWLSQYDPASCVVMLEKAYASPKFSMGVTGAFAFGRGIGILVGALTALGYEINEVAPSQWKPAAGVKGGDKEGARHKAQELWGAQHFFLVRDNDKAEAALLGYYGAICRGVIK